MLICWICHVLSSNELGECVRCFHHWRNDVTYADLTGFKEITNCLTSTNLEGQLEICPTGKFDEPEKLIYSRSFGLKFGFYCYVPKLLVTLSKDLEHLTLLRVHCPPDQHLKSAPLMVSVGKKTEYLLGNCYR